MNIETLKTEIARLAKYEALNLAAGNMGQWRFWRVRRNELEARLTAALKA